MMEVPSVVDGLGWRTDDAGNMKPVSYEGINLLNILIDSNAALDIEESAVMIIKMTTL